MPCSWKGRHLLAWRVSEARSQKRPSDRNTSRDPSTRDGFELIEWRNPLKILHTSDWHLGLSTGAVSRLEDQRLFLAWLTEKLRTEKVDVLVVAGDVFESMQPSAEAQKTYYRFLAGLSASGVRDVVIVGGNHDSSSRLDAPREVLSALDVHVIGGLPTQGDSIDSLIVPLRCRESNEVRAVCLAVPFVHEYRLGVRTTELDRAVVAEAFRERFTVLYQNLADRAEELYPGRPLIATGHLVLGDAQFESHQNEIHQVGFIGGLPASVLDPRLTYAALGHLHHVGQVADGKGWYSGSPLPISLTEDGHSRKVLLVDLTEAGEASVEPIDVPVFRDLHTVEGTPEELEEALGALESSAPLPSLLYVRARLEAPEAGLRARLAETLSKISESKRPQIIEIVEIFVGSTQDLHSEEPLPSLAELSLDDVFTKLCRSRGIANDSDLKRALTSLKTMSDDDFGTLVENTRNGEGGAS